MCSVKSKKLVKNSTPLGSSPPSLSPIADTGTTAHFFAVDSPLLMNKQKTNSPLKVTLPDNSVITSTHTAELQLPSLPPEACRAHLFPSLGNTSLLSIGQLCDAGCTATFTASKVTVAHKNQIILSGSRKNSTQRLWIIELPVGTQPATQHSALSAITMPHKAAELVKFYHAALFSPALSTLHKALQKNLLPTMPGLNLTTLKKYPPISVATHKGHMDQSRANQRSTKLQTTHPAEPHAEEPDYFPPAIPAGTATHTIFAQVVNLTPEGQIHTDQTGRFPTKSLKGNHYVMILYAYDANAILQAPLKDRNAHTILEAYKMLHARLVKAGLRPKLQRLDNECSTILKEFLHESNIDFQLSPPGMHRRNAAERAIRTFKNHFTAGLASTDPKFPLSLWDELLEQAEITLNMLRQSRLNPQLSACTQLEKVFDFNRTPLAPPGTRVLVHEKPHNRGSWDPHGVDGWCIGPAMDSCRCYKTWIWKTKSKRITDTLEWFPHYVKMPSTSPLDLIVAAVADISNSIKKFPVNSPLHPFTDSQLQALRNLHEQFVPNAILDATLPQPEHDPPAAPLLRVPTPGRNFITNSTFDTTLPQPVHTAPTAPLLRVPSQREQPLPLRVMETDANPAAHTHSNTDDPEVIPAPVNEPIQDAGTEACPPAPQQLVPPLPSPTTTPDAATPPPAVNTRSHSRTQQPHVISQEVGENTSPFYDFDTILDHRRSNSKGSTHDVKIQWKGNYAPTWEPVKTFTDDYINEKATRDLAEYAQRNRLLNTKGFRNLHHFLNYAAKTIDGTLPKSSSQKQLKKHHEPVVHRMSLTPEQQAFFHSCMSAVHPDTGRSVEYPALLKSSDGKHWEESNCEEIGRLAQGYLPNIPQGTNTLHFIRFDQVPKDRKVTYLRVVVADRPMKTNPRRVRWTVGGDQLDYPGDVSTKTSDMVTAKILFNSVLSTKGARFMGVDLKDFYLNSNMDRAEYMRIPIKMIPQRIIDLYNLQPLVHNGYIYSEISKTMYGLSQAGKLSNDKLLPILAEAGYHQSEHIPGLFKHETRPVAFALVVDDFGIKYVGKENAQHLIDTLTQADYKVTEDWEGKSFCGVQLKWDYDNGTVDLSMDGYVEKALQKFMHPTPSRPTHSPHQWTKPQYGVKTQLTKAPDTSPPLDKSGIKRVQQIIGTMLFYARAIDNTMLVAIGSIAAAQSKGTEATLDACIQLLNYATTHPNATIRYTKSDMILIGHSDASYLSESFARSRAGGYFYLGDLTHINKPPLKPNGAVHILSTIMNNVLASATEAEVGALFHNAQDACTLRTTLEFLGHPQPATPIQTDNACAEGIINDTVKAKRSKAMDMRFYWVRDRVKQGQFLIHWKPGAINLADYHTKHHPAAHHKEMRSVYLHEESNSVKQCINHCEGVLISQDPSTNDYALLLMPTGQGLKAPCPLGTPT